MKAKVELFCALLLFSVVYWVRPVTYGYGIVMCLFVGVWNWLEFIHKNDLLKLKGKPKIEGEGHGSH